MSLKVVLSFVGFESFDDFVAAAVVAELDVELMGAWLVPLCTIIVEEQYILVLAWQARSGRDD